MPATERHLRGVVGVNDPTSRFGNWSLHVDQPTRTNTAVVEQMVRTLIVDDDPDMRALVRAVIEMADNGLQVAGEAADGAAGVDQVLVLRPDVAIVDQRMPDMSGVEMVDRLRSGGSDVKVIFFSAYLSDDVRRDMDRLGPCAIVRKDQFQTLPQHLRDCSAA